MNRGQYLPSNFRIDGHADLRQQLRNDADMRIPLYIQQRNPSCLSDTDRTIKTRNNLPDNLRISSSLHIVVRQNLNYW